MRGCFILFCFPCHSILGSGNVNHADLLLESIRLFTSRRQNNAFLHLSRYTCWYWTLLYLKRTPCYCLRTYSRLRPGYVRVQGSFLGKDCIITRLTLICLTIRFGTFPGQILKKHLSPVGVNSAIMPHVVMHCTLNWRAVWVCESNMRTGGPIYSYTKWEDWGKQKNPSISTQCICRVLGREKDTAVIRTNLLNLLIENYDL